MADGSGSASTTEAVAAQSQSRGIAGSHPAGAKMQARPRRPGPPAQAYVTGAGIMQAPLGPYERRKDDPLYRQLRIYAIDPSTPRLEGAVALVDVPYEPLQPGPAGRLFEVDDYDAGEQVRYRSADLDDKAVLIRCGYPPSQSDPRFHQQMVYAVCSNIYATFRKALGRPIAWRAGVDKLVIHPHACEEHNAWYDEGRIFFGYYKAHPVRTVGNILPGGYVFTCLSHDIVAHEVTHALLDGLRAKFSRPSGPDVIAFHEAFADLIAVFQRFSYREVVRNAIRTSRGDIRKAQYLTALALEFGHSIGQQSALRTALGADPASGAPLLYREGREPHELGSVLVAAIFEAFITIYQRKSERYIRLATAGTGILPAGEMPHDLQDLLAGQVSALASQFLSICIRAIDYCPPIDLSFGEYLRALVTADADLVPDDAWDYRGALIAAFRRRQIHPRDVGSLSEDALLWKGTRKAMSAIRGLSFAELQFRGDPGSAVGGEELLRQACALGEFITRPEYLTEFGLVAQDDPRLGGDRVSPPCVESLRISRRAGPDGQIVFDLVAEVTQARFAGAGEGCPPFVLYGGSTIILGPQGEVRYAILKSVIGAQRLGRRRAFLKSDIGRASWEWAEGEYRPRKQLFRLLHGGKVAGAG